MRQRTSGRRPTKTSRPPKKRNRKNGSLTSRNGRQNLGMAGASAGVCQKCGHPAPDGKLCQFHRNLLNSMRNGFK